MALPDQTTDRLEVAQRGELFPPGTSSIEERIAALRKKKAELDKKNAELDARRAKSAKQRAELAKKNAELDAREARFYSDQERHLRAVLNAVRTINGYTSGGRLRVLDQPHLRDEAQQDEDEPQQLNAIQQHWRVITLIEYHLTLEKTTAGDLVSCTLGFCTQDRDYGQITFGESLESSSETPALWCQYQVKDEVFSGTLSDESGCFRELIVKLQAEDAGLPLTLDDGHFLSSRPLILLIERCIEALNGRTHVKEERPAYLSPFLDQLVIEHQRPTETDQPLPEPWISALGDMIGLSKNLVLHSLRFQVSSGLIDLKTINPRIPQGESNACDRLLPRLLPHLLQLLEPTRLLGLLLTVHHRAPKLLHTIFLTHAALSQHIFQHLLTNQPEAHSLSTGQRAAIKIAARLPERLQHSLLQNVLNTIRTTSENEQQDTLFSTAIPGVPLSSTTHTLFAMHPSEAAGTHSASSSIPSIISNHPHHSSSNH